MRDGRYESLTERLQRRDASSSPWQRVRNAKAVAALAILITAASGLAVYAFFWR